LLSFEKVKKTSVLFYVELVIIMKFDFQLIMRKGKKNLFNFT